MLRSFVQLTAVGYVIQAIFDSDSLWLVAALLAGMVAFGTFTARGRAKGVPGALGPIALALAVAAAVTLGLVLALGVFEAEPRYLVPVGGMVIGNAMTAAAVALNRLADEMHDGRRQIEATLALGATSRQAARAPVTRSLRSGMIPLIDSTKTTGIVFFPGRWSGCWWPAPSRSTPCGSSWSCSGCCSARSRSRADRGVARLPRLLHRGPPAARRSDRLLGLSLRRPQ